MPIYILFSCSPSAADQCKIYDYDFTLFSRMPYGEALEYIRNIPRPPLVSCVSNPDSMMMYEMNGDSIVPEVGLTREKYQALNSINTIYI